MTDLALAYTPATELARRIRAKEVSPIELIDNSLARIDEVEPTINAFCLTCPDEAREKAVAAEQAVMAGDDLGPLHGVPIAFKDLTATKGKRTTMGGSYMFENHVPDEDAAVVSRLEDAGMIALGKTTSPEFGYSGFTQSKMWGVTRNPWNLEHTPGGSSGGAAAAVASGCLPFAEGSDGGGSVRIPASFCNLVGLKPSIGRIPYTGAVNPFDTFSHHGPLSHTVDDAAMFLKLTQGADERDVKSIPTPIEVPIPVPVDVRGMRLALSLDFGCYTIDPEIEANTRAAAQALADAGAEVEEIDLGWPVENLAAFYSFWDVRYAYRFADQIGEWGDRMDPLIVKAVERARDFGVAELLDFERVRTGMGRKLAPVLQDYDAMLCPTASDPVPRVDQSDPDFDRIDANGRLHGYMTCQFNMISQCPVLTEPPGFSAGNLPPGMQIVGRRFDDLGVLRVGAALESARPWAGRHPDI